MNTRLIQVLSAALLSGWLCLSNEVLAASNCGADGRQESGSIYRICMPDPQDYNGRLIVWAHGFQDAGTPVQIPEDQLQFGDTSLPQIANALGFGFATNSYRKTGLAVVQGMEDIIDLVAIYQDEQGPPQKVYLTGASEGGIITALLLEQHPEIFSGGLAACGPVGDFPFQMRYFGDARATFEYFFPGLIPGDPFHPSQNLINRWSTYYASRVRPIVFAPGNEDRLNQWVKVAKLPYDPADPLATLEQTVQDVLRYAVVNLNDTVMTLGGFPYDNRTRWYSGSANDLLLNLLVPRVDADPAAVAEMETHYSTTGQLENPLMTIHTTLDQQVPYRHEILYTLKTAAAGTFIKKHLNFKIPRYGHCQFTPGEVLFVLATLLFYSDDLAMLEGVGSVLNGSALQDFETLAQQNRLPYRREGDKLRAIFNH